MVTIGKFCRWYDRWFLNFPQRVWRYRYWLADDIDWDWCSLVKIMELKLEAMAKVFDDGHHVNCERDARECRIAAKLCRRLHREEYTLAQRINRVPKNDQRLLGHMIGRRLMNWWD